jgi:cysteinyl-tRNA synthetase
MLELIGRLVELGHAYVGEDGTVYFDARSYDGYGQLSGNRLEDLRAGTGWRPPTSARASGSTPTGPCGSVPAPAAR